MSNDCRAGTCVRLAVPWRLRKVPFALTVFLFLCVFLASSPAWASGVTIHTPGGSTQVTGRTPFSATATSNGQPVTAMYVYLDYQNPPLATYNGNGTSSLSVNTTYSIANGSHTLIVNAWDTQGTLYKSTVSFTVSATGVVLNAPGESAQSTSPVPFSATVTSNGPAVSSVLVYLDWNPNQIASYSGNGSSTFTANATFSMANGSHILIVNSWDNNGQLYQTAVDFTVSSNGVIISAPTQNQQVSSPVAFSATATSNGPAISSMLTYLDFNPNAIGSYNGNGTSTLSVQDNYTISTTGARTIIANAWDNNGQLYQAAVDFTVTTGGGGGGGSIPPSNATLIDNIDDNTHWTSCSSTDCSGAGGGSQTTTFGVMNPSLDSNGSVQFYTTGAAFADVLHGNNSIGNNNSITHFVLDYNFQVDNVAPIETLEFDFVQVTDTQKFNFSSQCDNQDPNNPVWDTFDDVSVSWSPTSISCANVLNANNWHHVRLYGEILGLGTSSAQTHYIWIEVDGVQSTIDVTHNIGPYPAGWQSSFIVQVQEDLNANPGNGFNEYVDKLKLYVW